MNKRINFNIKDRKVLYVILCIVLISVFTLTIAYAALNAVLTIQGTAQVSSADWDIHMENPKVTSESATTTVPSINGNNLTFSTTLNMPGDFYEFTVDVVNAGSIDAMINSVIKNPELDASQKKYLNYEVSYQNGESITTKQTLSKGTTIPIKVRIEYRKDLVASDLPTGQVVLNLSLTLEYIQSDGTGTTVKDNGVAASNVSANGDIDAIGTIVTIGDQQFYTIGTEGENVKLLSMYNLYVGGVYNSRWTAYGEEATGKQDSTMLGYVSKQSIRNGITAFSSSRQKGTNYSDYSGSIVEGYVNNYKTILETDYGVDVVEARLISHDELTNSETFACVEYDYCSDKYLWIYSTSYWSGSASDTNFIWRVGSDGYFGRSSYDYGSYYGVRPVIVISKDYFLTENKEITFTIAGVSYQAMNGMTWEEWLDSDYAPANAYSNYTGASKVISVAGYDIKTSGGTYITPDDTIIAGHAYINGASSEPR